MLLCPFCKNLVGKFHKRSHVLPEWMYTEIYNEKHKLIEISKEKQRATKKQKGFYFEFICEDCEKATQTYDRYASLILTNRSPNSPEYLSVRRKFFPIKYPGEDLSLEQWYNLDFINFQKFVFASILRAHFSGSIKGCAQLNNFHSEKIFSLYNSKKTLDDNSYPIVIYKLKNNDPFKHQVVLPYFKRYSGHHLIEFMGNGYIFNLFVSSHKKPDFVDLFRLKIDGSVLFPLMNFKDMGLFAKTLHLVKATLNHSSFFKP